MSEKITDNEITDEQAVEALKNRRGGRAQPADTFAVRTILYPVAIERKKGTVEIENRNYVTMGQYYPKRKWEKALDVEKRYSQLNKAYVAELKARKLPISRKDPGNLLNSSPIELGK